MHTTLRPWSALATIGLLCGLAPVGPRPAYAETAPKLVEVRKIWDQAPHNAFTDLVRFHDRWFCVFREGAGHVSPDGALRVITSTDGQQWESAALLTSANSDLRDPKISLTPDGKLMLAAAEAFHNKSRQSHQSLTWFSDDGRSWGDKQPIGDPDFWLWRVTWQRGKAYSVGYPYREDAPVRLYRSDGGKKFDRLVERLFAVDAPNESALVFDGETGYCLLRRETGSKSAVLGISQAPYTDWQWKDLGVPIGGPEMILAPNGLLLAAVRLYDGGSHTGLAWIDPRTGSFSEFLKLPSGGDNSYAGLALHAGLLWVSYYSSHEGKTSIYLAKVQLPESPPDR